MSDVADSEENMMQFKARTHGSKYPRNVAQS